MSFHNTLSLREFVLYLSHLYLLSLYTSQTPEHHNLFTWHLPRVYRPLFLFFQNSSFPSNFESPDVSGIRTSFLVYFTHQNGVIDNSTRVPVTVMCLSVSVVSVSVPFIPSFLYFDDLLLSSFHGAHTSVPWITFLLRDFRPPLT